MSSIRFPRAAYVRRLESLYADLGDWRDRYYGQANQAFARQEEERFRDREYALAEAQRLVMDVVMCLDGMPRLS